jgi:hypothetical protein
MCANRVSAESNDHALQPFQDFDLPLMHGGLAPLPFHVGQCCMKYMPRKPYKPEEKKGDPSQNRSS